jgi:Periplasmic binding protein
VRNYARVVPTDDIQGAIGTAWAKQLGAQKVYVLDDTELYGHGIALMFAETARAIGLDVVGGPDGIDGKAVDYRAVAQKIQHSGADLVYFGGTTQSNAGKLWLDLRTFMPNVRLVDHSQAEGHAFYGHHSIRRPRRVCALAPSSFTGSPNGSTRFCVRSHPSRQPSFNGSSTDCTGQSSILPTKYWGTNG